MHSLYNKTQQEFTFNLPNFDLSGCKFDLKRHFCWFVRFKTLNSVIYTKLAFSTMPHNVHSFYLVSQRSVPWVTSLLPRLCSCRISENLWWHANWSANWEEYLPKTTLPFVHLSTKLYIVLVLFYLQPHFAHIFDVWQRHVGFKGWVLGETTKFKMFFSCFFPSYFYILKTNGRHCNVCYIIF